MRGIIFCHGHIYNNKLPIWLPKDVQWTMVDINPKTKPDIVGDYKSLNTLFDLGLYQYDYVLNLHCQVGPVTSLDATKEVLRAARLLLKNNGIMYMPNQIIGLILYKSGVLAKGHYMLESTVVSAILDKYKTSESTFPYVDDLIHELMETCLYKSYMLLPEELHRYNDYVSVAFIV